MTYPPDDTPRVYNHELNPELFTGDRLDALCREADRRHTLKVQFADPGRQRYGNDPMYTRPSYPILDDVMRRPVQYRIEDVAVFAGPEYQECLDAIFAREGTDPALGRIAPTSVVRVFSPNAVVALHGDPDLKLVSAITGETVWWVRPPSTMSIEDHEELLRGQFFLPWTEREDEALVLHPGQGCFLPSRWPHWLTHPTEEPTVSFEIGYWTEASVRERKVYDVNWLLRRLGLHPEPPGGPRDDVKRRAFDGISTVTRKGLQYRGV